MRYAITIENKNKRSIIIMAGKVYIVNQEYKAQYKVFFVDQQYKEISFAVSDICIAKPQAYIFEFYIGFFVSLSAHWALFTLPRREFVLAVLFANSLCHFSICHVEPAETSNR